MSVSGDKSYRNLRFRQRHIPFAILLWLPLYFAPGLILTRFVNPTLGLLWMLLGAAMLLKFVWRCYFPTTLTVDRDGFRVERPGRRKSIVVGLGFEKIHEARWVDSPAPMRGLLGPLVFIEPIWPAQRKGTHRLLISHAGQTIVLRQDEYLHLDDFVETLKEARIAGLAEKKVGLTSRPFYGTVPKPPPPRPF